MSSDSMATILKILKQFWFLLLPAFFFLASCDKFEGNQTIPSYLKIESLGFTSDILSQGTNKQNFTDVWVYVDDDLIGGFEMPARIPILVEGNHKLEVRPGIILNGISDTRAPYPCAKPIILNDFNFIPDSVVGFYSTTSYYDNVEFVWMEDFEDPSLSIVKANSSDTGIYLTQPAGAPGAFLDENSEYSGIISLDALRNYLLVTSDDGNGQGFVFDRGDFIFLELHYRNDFPMAIGAFIQKTDNTIQKRSFIILNPSGIWKKVYINFTPMVNETVDAVNYKIYFESDHSLTGSDGVIMIDNIKLLTRPNL